MRIGLIAALEEEAEAVFPSAGERVQSGPLALRHLAVAGHDLVIAVSGVGKVNAALAASWLVAREGAALLLVTGTAGRIAAGAGGAYWIESAVQHDYGAERSQGFVHYSAGAWPIGPASVEPFLAMPDPGLGLPHARAASGDAFIECPDHARFLAEGLSAELVDMETAAVAQVAARCGLPWAAIRAVSDGANGESADDFQTNLLNAARAAGAAMERLIGMVGS